MRVKVEKGTGRMKKYIPSPPDNMQISYQLGGPTMTKTEILIKLSLLPIILPCYILGVVYQCIISGFKGGRSDTKNLIE